MTLGIDERLNDPERVHRSAFGSLIVGIWSAMPGYVVSFDASSVTAQIQLGIQGQQLMPDGSVSPMNYPMLQDVPVVFPRGGGATLTFPVSAGDECLVVFASRSIDAWWQSGGIQSPSDSRTHSLSDGFAILGPQSQANKISGISTTTTQLRSDDGSTYVELDASGQTINVVAPNGFKCTGPAEFTSTVTIDDSLTVTNDISSTSGDISTADVSLNTHTHSGVETGSDESGPPT